MAKRLVKIAKELNVGTATIVDFLDGKGFDIENKPTAKVTEEMEQELLKEFSKSIAIKEQADKMVIGTRPVSPSGRKEPEVEPQEVKKAASPEPQAKSTPAPPPPPPPVEEVVEKVEEPVEEVVKATAPKLKVLGKIDLSARNKKKPVEKPAEPEPVKEEPPVVKEEVEEPKVEEVKVEEPKAEEPAAPAPVVEQKEIKEEVKEEAPAPVKKEEPVVAKKEEEKEPVKEEPAENKAPTPPKKKETKQPPTPTPKVEKPSAKKDDGEAAPSESQTEEETIRPEAPQLRGLKVMGKIDLGNRVGSRRNKKNKDDDKKKTGNAGGDNKQQDKNKPAGQQGGQGQGGDRPKRKRKRRKISADQRGGGGQGRGGNNRGGNNRRGGKDQEPNEVSKKQIEDKIKATMARISGGGKKKRQRQRRDNRERIREKQEMLEAAKETGKLQVTEFISVSELANLMDVAVTDVIMACMNLGVIVSINQRLDAEIIELVASEFEFEIEFISAEEQVDEEVEEEDDPADLEGRSPIVTVMGHVDHGKTSLLDYIRESDVAEGEAGGITQHIGAYEVRVGEERKPITFLDTPGHEAFTAMRARGAKVTDIAIIIIAADDSIMPQTREAISHAQAAGVPIVFAINKIDKPGANPDRIKQELASMNLLIEEWGGSYQSQDISAKTGDGIPDLLEKILLEAEVLELQANPDRDAIGAVLEASLDKGRGYVTKILVQTGTLKIGDPIVAGEHSGKVRAMFNERNKRVDQAGPSTPVLVLGMSGAPQAGERFKVMESEQEARQIAGKRARIAREQTNRATKRVSLDEIGRRLALGTFKELNLIVKGDFDGSVEALSDSLIKLSQETVQVNVIHRAVGQITESDVLLATASEALIVGFQVRPSLNARKLAEREGVEIKTYSIIYNAIEEIGSAIEGMLEPTQEEKTLANVEVREVFKISKIGTVAGCFVTDGRVARDSHIRLVRDGIVIYPTKEGQHGEIDSLKRFKDDVKEVRNGMECGISIKNFNDIKVGDVIEAYEIVEIKQTLA